MPSRLLRHYSSDTEYLVLSQHGRCRYSGAKNIITSAGPVHLCITCVLVMPYQYGDILIFNNLGSVNALE